MNPVAWHRSLASSRRSRSTHLTSPAADLGKTRNEIEIKYTYYFCVLILGPKKITQPEFGLRAQKKFRFHVSLLGGGISPARAGPVVLGDVEVAVPWPVAVVVWHCIDRGQQRRQVQSPRVVQGR